MGRKDAERLLLVPGNQRGTFLARESETTKGEKVTPAAHFRTADASLQTYDCVCAHTSYTRCTCAQEFCVFGNVFIVHLSIIYLPRNKKKILKKVSIFL